MATYAYRCVGCKTQFVGNWLRPVDVPLCSACSSEAERLVVRLAESLGTPPSGFGLRFARADAHPALAADAPRGRNTGAAGRASLHLA